MRGRRLVAPLAAVALTAGASGGARAWDAYGFYGYTDQFPLPPPLPLPQQLNGVIRSSSEIAETVRIDHIRQVFSAVRACWRPPDVENGAPGLQVTMRMSFKRSGEIIGKPAITYMKTVGERRDRERFVGSVMTAFKSCVPLPFTKDFGSAIAGRPFTFRFVDDRKT